MELAQFLHRFSVHFFIILSHRTSASDRKAVLSVSELDFAFHHKSEARSWWKNQQSGEFFHSISEQHDPGVNTVIDNQSSVRIGFAATNRVILISDFLYSHIFCIFVYSEKSIYAFRIFKNTVCKICPFWGQIGICGLVNQSFRRNGNQFRVVAVFYQFSPLWLRVPRFC